MPSILQPSTHTSEEAPKTVVPDVLSPVMEQQGMDASILKDIEISKGENFVTFSLLEDEPIKAGFSWGRDQMSVGWAEKNLRARGVTDISQIEKAKNDALMARKHFLEVGGMAVPPRAAIIGWAKIRPIKQIREITEEEVSSHGESGTSTEIVCIENFLVTKVKGFTLLSNQADCYSWIIEGTDDDENIVIGLLHAGRDEITGELPKQAVSYMHALGCKTSSLLIAGCPGIAKESYYIKEKDREALLKGKDSLWNGYMKEGTVDENGVSQRVIFLDLLGCSLGQFVSLGLKPEQIQIYGVDTYEAAKRGETFSHRYWLRTNTPSNPIDNGRMTMAVMINED